MKLAVKFLNQTKAKIDGRAIASHLNKIAERLSLPNRPDNLEVELVLMANKQMRGLNRQFRRLDQSTDVLSFETKAAGMLGSIVVNPVMASRYASQSSGDLIGELKILSGHGLLHLLGFDHR